MSLILLRTLSKATRSCRPQEVLDTNPYLPAGLCAVSLCRDRQGEEKPGFAHMQVLDNASVRTIESFLERRGYGPATEESKDLLEAIRTDGWRSYGKTIKGTNVSHYKAAFRDTKAAGRLLTWVHRVISNAKTC